MEEGDQETGGDECVHHLDGGENVKVCMSNCTHYVSVKLPFKNNER